MSEQKPPPRPRLALKKSLGLTLFLWFLGISMVPLTVISILGYRNARQSLQEDAERALIQNVVLRAAFIESEFKEQVRDLKNLARAGSTRQLLGLLTMNRDGAPPKEFVKSQTWSVISGAHGQDLIQFQEIYGYQDVLLVDDKGNILFTIKNGDDLGSNLFDGELANTKLSAACRTAFSRRRTVYSDIEYYDPSGILTSFLVHPITRYEERLGLVVLQVPLHQIDAMLKGGLGRGRSGETYLVGHDQFVRSGSSSLESSEAMAYRIDTKAVKLWEMEMGRRGSGEKKTPQETQGTQVSGDQAPASPRVITYQGHRDQEVMGTWKNLDGLEELGVRWALIAEIGTDKAFEPVKELGAVITGLFLITAALVIAIALFTTRRMIRPLVSLAGWARAVAGGDLAEVEIRAPGNEIGSLGRNFTEMTRSLRLARDESGRLNWINKGLGALNERMLEGNSVAALGRIVIDYLAGYLNILVGRFYVVGEDDRLTPVAGYAVKKKEEGETPLEPGQGLVGEVCRSRKPIGLDNVPVGYLDISSGLGAIAPEQLYVFPLIHGRRVRGVVEIGLRERLGDKEKVFLERAGQRIALAIDGNLAWTKTTELLERTKGQAEKLQTQQEELRQTNEELEEQARALKKSEEGLQAQQEELRVTNEELEERTKSLEEQRTALNSRNRDLQQAQSEIEEKAQALERASKYKSEFLANMSHELRTPLNSILILSQLLFANKDGNLTEKQKEFAETINTSGSDLLKLINEILDLSKVEAGKIEIHPEELPLADLTETMKRTFNPVAQKKGLEFSISLAPGTPKNIVTDILRLEQVVKNLLSNAFKFTSKGRVGLSIAHPEEGEELTVEGLSADQTLVFTVNDTGIGIPADKQALIFESFKQADGTTSRKYGGTGLGLAISKRLVELMGGEIRMESREGQGTTFKVFLPQSVGAELRPVTEPEAKEEPRPKAPERIEVKPEPASTEEIFDDRKNIHPEDKSLLVIEDDPKFAKILIDLAGEKGFKGLIAGDGEMGLHFADYYNPSAIILDITLPGLTGWEVMERLKENPKTRPIPVHFISAMDDSIEAMKMGAIGYLTKPVSAQQLDGAFNRIEDIITREVKRILVVEDDAVQAESIRALITAGDVETTLAKTGQEAFRMIKEESFDCLILDLGLEDISGFDLLSKIRRDKDISKFPVIIYTGREISEEEEADLKRYTESIIIKDVRSPERLLAETTLFLHRVEANLPQEQRNLLKMVHAKESVLEGKKILVVDDDMRNVFALSSILEEKGIDVVMARNGREGIDKLDQNQDTDLVLMDIMMPEMNGYEAMEEIRKQPRYKELPIIALTAKAMRGDRKKCIDAGASDYLAKPVDTGKLVSLLRVWLYK